MLVSIFLVGKDGRTGYEMRRGRRCSLAVVPFGETVWYKKIREGKVTTYKFESEWEEGLWLGHTRSSNDVLIGTRTGVIRAYSIRRKEEGKRWDSELILEMQGTPQRPDPGKPGLHVPILINFDPPAIVDPEDKGLNNENGRMRRMKITDEMLRKYGYDENCLRCRNRKAGLASKMNHSEQCRKRIYEEMEKDEDGRKKKQQNEERENRRIAEEIERNVDKEKSHDEDGMDGEFKYEQAVDIQMGASSSSSGLKRDASGREIGNSRIKGIQNESREEREAEGKHAESPEKKNKRSDGELQDDDMEQDVDNEMPNDRLGRLHTRLVKVLSRINVDAAEIYSLPRFGEAEKMGLKAGEVMDLLIGWDFRRKDHRDAAKKYIEEHKPLLLIGSPMSTRLSSQGKEQKWMEARQHMKFVIELYKTQMKAGKFFVHEQPAGATAGSLKEVLDLVKDHGVYVSLAHVREHGIQRWDDEGNVVAANTPTRFITNSDSISLQLRRNCIGKLKQQEVLEGSRQGKAATYPKRLCEAICHGLVEEKELSIRNIKRIITVQKVSQVQTLHQLRSLNVVTNEDHEEICQQVKQAWDDVTGEVLDTKKVEEARIKEVEYLISENVWTKILRGEAAQKGYKIVKTRWLDINKGDSEQPKYRSRFVGKEFNDGPQDGLFAATPPLEALKLLISELATYDDMNEEKKVVMINDVARAFFKAPATRKLCVELPEELKDAKRDEVGLLNKSLYGTRDAAANFQSLVKTVMTQCGFRQSHQNPCTYVHKGKKIRTLVHGDDFVSVGSRMALKWFKE